MQHKVMGQYEHSLERQGTPIGAYDLMIAAHALSLWFNISYK